ncbi:MAG: CehA/McbA family metallohydrolase [Candidatus Bathyarchaeota archaeon]|nr:CehA/McbA family metallohydrolase [Candidatus Bathyarchaeota archaeon]
MQIRADLHVHTFYSDDSIITPQDLVFYSKKRELTAVAVTDHNKIGSALAIAQQTDFLIIPGIEVSSKDGHIVGLNVNMPIPRGRSSEETVDLIHKAGGIAIACHPFALFKNSLSRHVTAKFDAVETINSSSFPFKHASRKAQEVAEKFNLPRVAGTDAHYGPVIGCAYTVIDADLSVESIVKAIKIGRCKPCGGSLPLRLRLENQSRFVKKYLRNK